LDENNVYAGGVIAANVTVTPTVSDDFVSAAFLVNDNTLMWSIYMKERRPVGLPATGNERHGVQGSTPVSEGCDRYHPLLLP